MKKRMGMGAVILLLALLCSGCTMRTLEQMYCVPRRSQSFDHVQSAMDMAMVGLQYAAPVSGENQQTVQLADLDGDGQDEYILFAKNATDSPLNVLVFDTDQEGQCFLLEVLELRGSAFQKVEYVQIDGRPGLELVVGRQLSDQLQGAVSVYSFGTGRAQQLLNTNYVHFLTSDLDRDDLGELLVIQAGESGQPSESTALASAYEYRGGEMVRSMELRLSAPASAVERILEGRLQDGAPAVFLSSTVDDSAIKTDVLCMTGDGLQNLAEQDQNVMALRNYYVYPTDIDRDGITELPSLIPMESAAEHEGPESRYLIRWYSLDTRGSRHEKRDTFHDYGGGWYLQLDPAWAGRLSVEKDGDVYDFRLWSEDGSRAEPLLSIYVFTGPDRDQKAGSDGRIPLLRREGVAYSAMLHEMAETCHLDENVLTNSFHLIRQDWKTGET